MGSLFEYLFYTGIELVNSCVLNTPFNDIECKNTYKFDLFYLIMSPFQVFIEFSHINIPFRNGTPEG